MKTREVRVPDTLLVAYELAAPAKVIWMCLYLDAQLEPRLLLSPTRLAKITGLSRMTVRKVLAQLFATGWYVESLC